MVVVRLVRVALLAVSLTALGSGVARADGAGEAAIAAFVKAAGWESVDPGKLEAAVPPVPGQGPVERALALVDAMDKDPGRTRTRLALGQVMEERRGQSAPVWLVEVTRFNLGPALRTLAITAYGADSVAGPEAFGIGPDVSWRFVFTPVMGAEAGIIEAVRRVPQAATGKRPQCLGRPCADPAAGLDAVRRWEEGRPPAGLPADPAPGLPDDVRVAGELLVAAGLAAPERGRIAWRGVEQPEAGAPGEPFLFLGIDRNLGQDDGVDAALRLTRLNDDSLSEMWVRRAQAGEDAGWFQASVKRRPPAK